MSGLEIVIKAHSGLRWLVLAFLVIGVGRAGWGWLTTQRYQRADRVWGAVTSGLMDVQVVLGLVIFFWLDPVVRPTLWHLILGVLAAVSVHGGSLAARRSTEDRRRQYAHLLGYLIGLLLVLLGIYAVRGSLF